MNRARHWVDMLLEEDEETFAHALGECFEYLLEHVDDWEDSEIEPGDLPRFKEEIQATIIYSVLFGTLWELSHPSIWAVMDGDGYLIGLYGHEENAEERAEDDPGWFVARQTVVDGDQPPEEILGKMEEAA